MTVQLGRSLEVARRFVPDVAAHERAISVDQTNESVVVGDRVIVKWLRPPIPSPHAGVVVLRHLAAVGFGEFPTLLGVSESDGFTVAIVSRFLPGALDGWDWFVDEVTAGIEAGNVDPVVQSAARLGALAGRLMVALATSSAVVPEPVSTMAGVALHAELLGLLADAMSLEPGAMLHDRADAIRSEFAGVGDRRELRIQLLHGDLHVGQLLRSDSELLVTDFDGDPLVPPELLRRFGPAERDVASLLQSVDHVMAVVARRRPEWCDDLGELASVASFTVRQELEKVPGIVIEPGLVRPLQIAQELHEYVYAVRHLPHWRYVPDISLPRLLP